MIHHNDNFIFKIHAPFVGSGFLVSHYGLRKPRHFYSLSPLGTIFDHNWWVFHPRGIYPFLLMPDTYFLFHATIRFYWTLSHFPSPPNQTPNAVSIYKPCTHTLEMRCFPYICNAKCHCMFSHVTCMMNTTWNNLKPVLYAKYHG